MAFATGLLNDPRQIGAGEQFGAGPHTILSTDNFEDNLVEGRFAKIDSGRLDNLDASSSPVLAGVVKRKVVNAVEDGSNLDSGVYSNVEYYRTGLVTVESVSGQTPTPFQDIYAHNQAGTDLGKATITTTSNVDANAEFVEAITATTWLIRLK